MNWGPPEEKPGIAIDGDELIRKIVTWAVLSVLVTVCFIIIIALVVWAGRILF